MMQRPATRNYSWDYMRYVLSQVSPDAAIKFDELMRDENKRPAVKLLQDNNVISRDAWLVF